MIDSFESCTMNKQNENKCAFVFDFCTSIKTNKQRNERRDILGFFSNRTRPSHSAWTSWCKMANQIPNIYRGMSPEWCLTLTQIQSPQRIANRKFQLIFDIVLNENRIEFWIYLYTIDIAKHDATGMVVWGVFHTPNEFNTCEMFFFLFFSFLFQCVFLLVRPKIFH